MHSPDPLHPPKLTNLHVARHFFREWLALLDPIRETFWVAHVDGEGNCLFLSQHDGNHHSVPFPLKEIVSDALEHNSVGLLLAHNHPSGDPRPSDHDCRATRLLVSITQGLNCTVFDHLIFAGSKCTSFRMMGLL